MRKKTLKSSRKRMQSRNRKYHKMSLSERQYYFALALMKKRDHAQ